MLPPLPAKPHALDLLIEGFAMLTTDGRAAATEVLQRAAEATMGLSVEDLIRWGWLASGASTATWDPDAELRMAERQVEVVRRVGALGELPIQLDGLALSLVARGDFADAAALIAESEGVAAETGAPISRIALLRLRALQGRETEASPLISSVIEQATEERRGAAVMVAHWAASVLNCGLARYDTAASSAQEVTQNAIDPWTILRALPELVEAATRIGDTQLAREALDHLVTTTQPAGTDFALGVEARSRALLSDGQTADRLFREAIDRLGRTGLRPETARAQLLFGEHLRREGHRVDAREQLRAAHATFDVIGMEAFAERARRELLATGEKARKRSDSSREDLTPQETQIAQLARDGYSNPEIGAQLFLSPRTIEWHLHHVFRKLGIRSRGQLSGALTEDGGQTSSSVGRSFVLLADGSTSPTTRARKADR